MLKPHRRINDYALWLLFFNEEYMSKTKQLTIASMCLAIGVILPQAFHAIPNAGIVILPMHIPVLVSGFLCGPLYGFFVGVLTPLLSHLIFQMPPTLMLAQMIVELSMYGFFTGFLNIVINNKNELAHNYIVLILSMIIGRVIYGIANSLLFKAGAYSLSIWLSAAFVTALPGIVIQLTIIPILVKTLKNWLDSI